MSLLKFCTGILALSAIVAPLHAGEPVAVDPKSSKTVIEDEFPYKKGVVEFNLAAGAFGSIGTQGTPKRPDTGYAIGTVQLGVMLSDVRGDGFLRGNFELVGEVFGGGIFEGPGDGLVGLDLYLRYNFVQPDSRVVPFFQVGGGGVYSDAADDDRIQRNIGSDFSFVLEAGLGVRYHLRPNLAITTLLEYRHISNASTADRNQGLNSLGGTLGVSLFF